MSNLRRLVLAIRHQIAAAITGFALVDGLEHSYFVSFVYVTLRLSLLNTSTASYGCYYAFDISTQASKAEGGNRKQTDLEHTPGDRVS